MTPRQAYALAHVLDYAHGDADIGPSFKHVDHDRSGRHILTILAVDRGMRLNDGRPVWHASVSIWSSDGRRKLTRPQQAERAGIALLDGVGNDREWWIFNDDPAVLVGHLRVGLSANEVVTIPQLPVFSDAGEAGPERARTRR